MCFNDGSIIDTLDLDIFIVQNINDFRSEPTFVLVIINCNSRSNNRTLHNFTGCIVRVISPHFTGQIDEFLPIFHWMDKKLRRRKEFTIKLDIKFLTLIRFSRFKATFCKRFYLYVAPSICQKNTFQKRPVPNGDEKSCILNRNFCSSCCLIFGFIFNAEFRGS